MTIQDPNPDHVDRVEETEVTQGSGYQERETVVNEVGVARERTASRVAQFLWLLCGIIEILLGLRFLLHLIGENPSAPFGSFIYTLSGFFFWPFLGLTGSPAAGGVVFEVPPLIAMLVYLLLFWVLVRLAWLLLYPTRDRRISTYRRRNE